MIACINSFDDLSQLSGSGCILFSQKVCNSFVSRTLRLWPDPAIQFILTLSSPRMYWSPVNFLTYRKITSLNARPRSERHPNRQRAMSTGIDFGTAPRAITVSVSSDMLNIVLKSLHCWIGTFPCQQSYRYVRVRLALFVPTLVVSEQGSLKNL